MARELSSDVVSVIEGTFIEPVLLAKFEFTDPVYVHTGLGSITYASNEYAGIGNIATIGAVRESELIAPTPFTVSVSGLDYNAVSKAKDASSYGDVVTTYYGYRQSDGTLYDNPIVFSKGKIERADLEQGETSGLSFTIDHDVSVLSEKDGRRFTDEDQQDAYSGDDIFSFVHIVPTQVLNWAGRNPVLGRSPSDVPGRTIRGDRGLLP